MTHPNTVKDYLLGIFALNWQYTAERQTGRKRVPAGFKPGHCGLSDLHLSQCGTEQFFTMIYNDTPDSKTLSNVNHIITHQLE